MVNFLQSGRAAVKDIATGETVLSIDSSDPLKAMTCARFCTLYLCVWCGVGEQACRVLVFSLTFLGTQAFVGVSSMFSDTARDTFNRDSGLTLEYETDCEVITLKTQDFQAPRPRLGRRCFFSPLVPAPHVRSV